MERISVSTPCGFINDESGALGREEIDIIAPAASHPQEYILLNSYDKSVFILSFLRG